MNRLIFIVACFFAGGAQARQADSARMYDLSKKIFIEPLELIDYYNMQSLRIGVEWPVVKDLCSVFGMVGLYPHQPPPYYGEYVRAGIKVYSSTMFRKSTSERTIYLSLHFFSKSQWFKENDEIRDSGRVPGEKASYDVRKKSFGFHLEVGNQFAYKHLCIETFAGIGIRQSTVVNSASDSLLSKLYHYHESQVTNIGSSNKYNAVLPSLSVGVRLSYLFKSRPALSQKQGISTHLKRRMAHYGQ